MIVERGHELANHSYTHINLSGLSIEDVRRELTRSNDAIDEIAGQLPVFFRSPFLANGGYISQVAEELGMSIINADAIGEDWNNITPQQIADNVLRNISEGSIILLHEQFSLTETRTKEALPIIFEELANRGYRVVTLSELVARSGAQLTPGAVYSRIN